MIIKFDNCVFGPWSLRRVLRAEVGPRERALAWGVVQERKGALPDLWPLMLSLLPGLGPVLGSMLGGAGRPAVLVVTETRLVLLDGKRKPGSAGWVLWEAWLGSAEIRRTGMGFEVRIEGEERPRRLRATCGGDRVEKTLKALAQASAGA